MGLYGVSMGPYESPYGVSVVPMGSLWGDSRARTPPPQQGVRLTLLGGRPAPHFFLWGQWGQWGSGSPIGTPWTQWIPIGTSPPTSV